MMKENWDCLTLKILTQPRKQSQKECKLTIMLYHKCRILKAVRFAPIEKGSRG